MDVWGPELGDREVAELLRAGAAAPSSHNAQPWTLRWADGAVEVHGDPERLLPSVDPEGRELRLSCGAVLFNVRVTARAHGLRARTQLLPGRFDPWLLGRVRPGGGCTPTPSEQAMAAAVHERRTNRDAFHPVPVPRRHTAELVRTAQREHCWLVVVEDTEQRRRLRSIAAEAHREQRRDPRFVEEWERWVGATDRVDDGIPAHTAASAPRPDDAWRLRDFAGGAVGVEERAAGRVEEEPTIAVLATFHDTPLAHLQAGQALQQVLLTATVRGLAASFVAAPVEVPDRRREVRELLGGLLWPQAVLRIGYGRSVSATPRRDPSRTAATDTP